MIELRLKTQIPSRIQPLHGLVFQAPSLHWCLHFQRRQSWNKIQLKKKKICYKTKTPSKNEASLNCEGDILESFVEIEGNNIQTKDFGRPNIAMFECSTRWSLNLLLY